MWPWNLMDDLQNDRAPLLYYIKLCAYLQSHRWIQTGVRVRKFSIWVKLDDFLVVWPSNLTDDLEELKDISSKLHHTLCITLSPYVNSNWSYGPETLNWVLTSVSLTIDLWPWPFVSASLLSLLVSPENSIMIRWWKYSERGVTGGRTDRHTDRQTDRLNHS